MVEQICHITNVLSSEEEKLVDLLSTILVDITLIQANESCSVPPLQP